MSSYAIVGFREKKEIDQEITTSFLSRCISSKIETILSTYSALRVCLITDFCLIIPRKKKSDSSCIVPYYFGESFQPKDIRFESSAVPKKIFFSYLLFLPSCPVLPFLKWKQNINKKFVLKKKEMMNMFLIFHFVWRTSYTRQNTKKKCDWITHRLWPLIEP